MASNGSSAATGKTTSNLVDNILSAVIVISTVVILIYDPKDCSNPVRAWLTTYVVCQAIQTTIFFISNYTSKGQLGGFGVFLGITLILLLIFKFVWLIIGSVWVFGESECADTAPLIWYDALIILIIIWLFIIIFIVACVIGCCMVKKAFNGIDEMNKELINKDDHHHHGQHGH